MKRTMMVMWLIPAIAVAQDVPHILGTLPNRDNAKITFTMIQGDCKKDDRMVFTQADGGQITTTGCYRIVGDDLFVIWKDGDIYTYPIDRLTFSLEMDAYLRKGR
jgi:hypothetical protein